MSKRKSRILSTLLASMLIVNQAMGGVSTPLDIHVSAVDSDFEATKGIFGYSSSEKYLFPLIPYTDSSIGGTYTSKGCPSSMRSVIYNVGNEYAVTSFVVQDSCFIDPRLTGTVKVETNQSAIEKDTLGNPSVSSVTYLSQSVTKNSNVWTFRREGRFGGSRSESTISNSTYDFKPTRYKITYTPSEADVALGVCLVSWKAAWDDSYQSSDNRNNVVTYVSNPFFAANKAAVDAVMQSLVAGETYTWYSDSSSYGGVSDYGCSLGLAGVDLVNLLRRDATDPTTSFSSTSVSKTYGDPAFSSGFTTNSDGAKTFTSSNTNVATVDATGKITIVGVGTTKITGSTAATSAYSASSAEMTLTVGKATPTISNVTATGITYGQTLADSTITGTAKLGSLAVAGKFTWKTDTSTAPKAGNQTYQYTFTPSDTTKYNSVSGNVTLSVAKKTGYLTGVTASGITYGQTLAFSEINHTDGIPGTFAWSSGTTKPNAGSTSYSYTFTPADTTNYAVQTGKVTVNTAKANPSITASPKNGITFGQTLDSAGINGTAKGVDNETLTGTWSYENGNTTKPQVSDSGTTKYKIVFQPSSGNYNSASIDTTVQVSPATLTASDVQVSASPITYGQTLSDSSLTLVSSKTPGHLEWISGTTKPSVSDSGVTQYAIRFIPDSANYNSLDLTTTVVVNKSDSTITPAVKSSLSATEITYGQILSDSRISGSKPVGLDGNEIPGYYVWSNPDTKPSVANSDVTEYDVTFIPSDEINYSRSTTSLTLKVNKAVPQITSAIKASLSASQITYGDTLASSIISGDLPVDAEGNTIAGTYVFADDAEAPDVADSNRTRYDVIFKPTDSINYTEVSGLQVTVPVIKATPVVTPEMQATISAGTITYNQTLADSQLTGTTPIAGHYEWVDETIAPSVADSGVTEYAVRFVPDDLDNNNIVEGITCKLIVNKATPDVNSTVLATIFTSDITYGDTLADSMISGDLPVNSLGAEVNGSYAWLDDTASPSVSDSETTPYTVVFTPVDTDNYTTATFTLTVKVNKADIIITSDVEASISATDIVYEQTLADSVLSGTMPIVNGSTLSGHYEWVDSSVVPAVSDSGTMSYEVVFKPDDSINYNDVTGLYTTLNIAKLTPSLDASVLDSLSASGITYGESLSDSTITGSTPRAGHWEWASPDTTPTVSDSDTTEFVIIFKPDDTDNYNEVQTMLKLEVSKATPAVTSDMLTVGDIIWGTKTGDATLTGNYPTLNGTNITGTYSWLSPDDVLDAGDQVVRVLFTPDDLTNFNTAEVEVTLHINPLVPTFTPEILSSVSASDITYGQTLASAILSGDVPVPGHYEWKEPDTFPTVADSNLTPYTVVFVPDSSNYASVEINCTVYVGKKIVRLTSDMISSITVGEITYGQRLSEATLTGTTPIAGRYMWIDNSIIPTVDGDNRYMVIFVPDDNDNYGIVEVEKKHVTVNKAEPVVDVANVVASGITYGESLNSAFIYATVPMSGSFAWVDGSITPSVADSGTTEYDVVYTPDDTVNYTSKTFKLTVTVTPAQTVLPSDVDTQIEAMSIKYGQSLGDSEIVLVTRASTLPAGTFTWSDPSIKPAMSDSDNTKYQVTFTPADTNYSTATTELSVHVDKADVPAEYIDLTDTIALNPGSSTKYDATNKVRLAGSSVTGITVTDVDGILTKAEQNGNLVDIAVTNKAAAEGHSAEIACVVSTRDYSDITLKLTVLVTACDHSAGTHLVGYKAPTATEPGYTGDKVCNNCGATVEFGTEIPPLQQTCKHTHTHIEGKVAATCSAEGYTGDIVCDDCQKVIKQGTVIPKTEHKHTKIENKVAATCHSEGYTGDKVCTDCGTVIERGTTIAKTAHVEGKPVVVKAATYSSTGLRAWYCTICGEEIRTEVIPKLTSGGGGGRPSRPSNPRPDPTDPDTPVNPDDPTNPDNPDKPKPTDPTNPDNPDDPNNPDTPKPDEPDEPDVPTEEPSEPTNEPDTPTEEPDDPGEPDTPTEEPGDDPDSPSDDPDEPTDDPDEPTVDPDNPSNPSGDTSETGNTGDSDEPSSDNTGELGIIKRVGIADGVYTHTPYDGHKHHFSTWVEKNGNPYPVYLHTCSDCGVIEAVASDTDPNTWDDNVRNPNTGVSDVVPIAGAIAGVAAAGIVLAMMNRKRKK